MSINLPAVIANVAQGASVINALVQPAQVSPPLLNPDPQDVKPIIILCTRDVSKADRKLLASFGLVKSYDDTIHLNLPLAQLEFKYLLVDLREPADRLFYQKAILGNSDYHQVLYKWNWETDMGLQFEAEFSDFPPVQASAMAFDKLLCTPPVPEPSACLSFLGVVSSCGKA